MNAKLFSPKNVKSTCGTDAMKQFLLSLVATTISIVLTFGTAIWLERDKKEEAKREMVMMILYDLSNTLSEIEEADSTLRAGFELQVAIAEDPHLYKQNALIYADLIPQVDYTETVENIFSSNIETINTIGNVLFSENVSDLYRRRKLYIETICEKIINDLKVEEGYPSYEQMIEVPYIQTILLSGLQLNKMKEEFVQCQQMMNVSDSDLEIYRQKRQNIAQTTESDSIMKALLKESDVNRLRLNEAIKKRENRNVD